MNSKNESRSRAFEFLLDYSWERFSTVGLWQDDMEGQKRIRPSVKNLGKPGHITPEAQTNTVYICQSGTGA